MNDDDKPGTIKEQDPEVNKLIEQAAIAEEACTADELEEFAARWREKNK